MSTRKGTTPEGIKFEIDETAISKRKLVILEFESPKCTTCHDYPEDKMVPHDVHLVPTKPRGTVEIPGQLDNLISTLLAKKILKVVVLLPP